MHIARAAAAACLSGIIFPLYFDPDDNCAAWTPLITSITNNPTLPFTVIINPDSGPGGPVGSVPDATYQACIPKLRPSVNPNVKLIGYVDTLFDDQTTRPPASITADIDTYAGWGSDYRLDGIFFDEVDTASAHLAQYTSYANHVRSLTWHSTAFVTLNPGMTVENTGFYNIADNIMSFEDTYASFSNRDLQLGSASPPSKQSVILHTAPTTPPTSTISTLVSDGIGLIYITDRTEAENPYNDFPVDWTTFVSALESAACS